MFVHNNIAIILVYFATQKRYTRSGYLIRDNLMIQHSLQTYKMIEKDDRYTQYTQNLNSPQKSRGFEIDFKFFEFTICIKHDLHKAQTW